MFKNCVLKVSVDTQKWVKSATVRAIKTMAQTAVSESQLEARWQMLIGNWQHLRQ